MNNNEQTPLRLNSNNTIICLEQAADVFNKYFLNLTNRVKSDYTENGSAMSFLKSSFPQGFSKNGKNTNHRSRISEHNFFTESKKFTWT